MRARVAYISSLGTTAILVAAAMLMLVVVSAIVAFRGWPGMANGSGVQSVPLAPPAGPANTVLARPAAFTRRVVRVSVRPAALVAVASRRAVSTAGLVKQPSGGGPIVHGLVMVSVPGATMHPASPRSGGPASVPPPVANPGGPGPGPAPVPANPAGPIAVPLPVPPPPGDSPGSDELSAVVNGLLSAGPPPPVAAVTHLLGR